MGTEPREIADMFADVVCVLEIGPRKSSEALNHGQREIVVQIIDQSSTGDDRRPLTVILTGLLHVMDATGR